MTASTDVSELLCPGCGAEFAANTPVLGDTIKTEIEKGDTGLCGDCGEMVTFDGAGGVRSMTLREWLEFERFRPDYTSLMRGYYYATMDRIKEDKE